MTTTNITTTTTTTTTTRTSSVESSRISQLPCIIRRLTFILGRREAVVVVSVMVVATAGCREDCGSGSSGGDGDGGGGCFPCGCIITNNTGQHAAQGYRAVTRERLDR
ncbi:hypothetical protein E2C01_049102 [Portunus trituberculatus]|uniref:Uncharacterized protein n=1 Tax=Portunus trituberculatus TaxID=210409 RepID=A0A5B7G8B3_PORTR|nr:hypothetical protein [Portunus trituberculatus]